MFGKNFVSDQLMLVFTDADRFVDNAKRNDLAEFERLVADHPEVAMDDRPRTWHTRLVGYSASAGSLRSRLKLQGFSSERVRSLCISFFDDELAHSTADGGVDQRDSWQEGQGTYPDGAAVTAALASRRGQAATVPRFGLTDPEQRFLHDQWVSLRESFDDPRFVLALALTNTSPRHHGHARPHRPRPLWMDDHRRHAPSRRPHSDGNRRRRERTRHRSSPRVPVMRAGYVVRWRQRPPLPRTCSSSSTSLSTGHLAALIGSCRSPKGWRPPES